MIPIPSIQNLKSSNYDKKTRNFPHFMIPNEIDISKAFENPNIVCPVSGTMRIYYDGKSSIRSIYLGDVKNEDFKRVRELKDLAEIQITKNVIIENFTIVCGVCRRPLLPERGIEHINVFGQPHRRMLICAGCHERGFPKNQRRIFSEEHRSTWV